MTDISLTRNRWPLGWNFKVTPIKNYKNRKFPEILTFLDAASKIWPFLEHILRYRNSPYLLFLIFKFQKFLLIQISILKSNISPDRHALIVVAAVKLQFSCLILWKRSTNIDTWKYDTYSFPIVSFFLFSFGLFMVGFVAINFFSSNCVGILEKYHVFHWNHYQIQSI